MVRIAVDSSPDALALAEIRARTQANLSVDLQENYRVARRLPRGSTRSATTRAISTITSAHRPWADKVRFLVDAALAHDFALRVGVNCGSVDPAKSEQFAADDWLSPMMASAWSTASCWTGWASRGIVFR